MIDGIKDDFEYCKLVKSILQREFNAFGNMKATVWCMSLDLNKKGDRQQLKDLITEMNIIFDKALKELEAKENDN